MVNIVKVHGMAWTIVWSIASVLVLVLLAYNTVVKAG